jgi:hypothetical protein
VGGGVSAVVTAGGGGVGAGVAVVAGCGAGAVGARVRAAVVVPPVGVPDEPDPEELDEELDE